MVCRESCWPAVTTSGVPDTLALSRLPRPWPSPPAVKIDKAGPAGHLRMAVGHRHHARLLQAPDVTDVGGIDQRVDQRQFGGAGIAENIPHAFAAQHIEQQGGTAAPGYLIQRRNRPLSLHHWSGLCPVHADGHDLMSDDSPLLNDQSSRPVPTRLMKTSSRRSRLARVHTEDRTAGLRARRPLAAVETGQSGKL
jgi:hypothetical protein